MVDGAERQVSSTDSLAVALFKLGISAFRRDSHGAGRGPVCGMGTCFECRVTVDGVSGIRACLQPTRRGMNVETGQ